MNLFDRMLRDMKTTAFRVDQFGTVHDIDGKTIVVVEDSERLQERNQQAALMGIDLGQLLYFVCPDDLATEPNEGARQIYDGRAGIVTSVKLDDAMYEITVNFNRG